MVNVAVCTATGNQGGSGLTVVPSSEGGAIAAWKEERAAGADIYAQGVLLTATFGDRFEEGDLSMWSAVLP